MSISLTEETTAIEQATTNKETAIIKQTASTERNVTIEKTDTTEQENTIEKTDSNKQTLNNEDIRNAVIHEYTVNGLSQRKIAAVVGISESTVYRILKAYGERVSLEPITDIETKPIITEEVEVNLQVESQSITDNEEIKQEQDQSSCTLDLQTNDEA